MLSKFLEHRNPSPSAQRQPGLPPPPVRRFVQYCFQNYSRFNIGVWFSRLKATRQGWPHWPTSHDWCTSAALCSGGWSDFKGRESLHKYLLELLRCERWGGEKSSLVNDHLLHDTHWNKMLSFRYISFALRVHVKGRIGGAENTCSAR